MDPQVTNFIAVTTTSLAEEPTDVLWRLEPQQSIQAAQTQPNMEGLCRTEGRHPDVSRTIMRIRTIRTLREGVFRQTPQLLDIPSA